MNRRDIVSKYRWIWLLSLVTIMSVDGVEFIQTDSDFGELFLIQNQGADGEWSALYVKQEMYFRHDSNRVICLEYSSDYYNQRSCIQIIEFYPTNLRVHRISQTSFPTGLFQPWFSKRLQHLQMSDVGIDEFQQNGLVDADALNILDLSHNALMEMPSKSFLHAPNLAEVDLSHNRIASMASDVFKIERIITTETAEGSLKPESVNDAPKQLTTILLNNNRLTFIDPEWFSDLLTLTKLTLNDNFITELNACSAFGTNIALRTLDLQNNEFFVIKTNGLTDSQCLNQLDSFDISNNTNSNGLHTIRANAATIDISHTNSSECFVPFNAIILRADHNRIDSVVVDLDQVPNFLQQLYLKHNKINSTDFLFDLEHLETIDLSHNELAQVNGNVFEKMSNLTTLNIAYNKFATIDLTFLQRTTQLTHLDISNNMLSGSLKLNVKAVELTALNISNNNLTSIPHNLGTQMPNLTSIDINGNFYDCEDLVLIILFLNLDHITPIIRGDDDFGSANNVRGIQCHQSNGELVAVGSAKNTYEATKEQLIERIDDKFEKLESKLIDLFNNVTASNVEDNTVQADVTDADE